MKKEDLKDGVFYKYLYIKDCIILHNKLNPTSSKGYWTGTWSDGHLSFGLQETYNVREATLEELNALGDEHLPYSKYLQEELGGITPKGDSITGDLDKEQEFYNNFKHSDYEVQDVVHKALMREFDSGATRNLSDDKFDFEGFLSPLALEEFAKYMHNHRLQADGKVRDSDNWQKGIDLDSYMKSMWRHFFDTWKQHRGLETPEDQITNLCAVIFNAQGMLHEILKAK